MGLSKESVSKFLVGNRFHVKLRILSPYSNSICKIQIEYTRLYISLIEYTRFYLNKDLGCVILREIDFLQKIC